MTIKKNQGVDLYVCFDKEITLGENLVMIVKRNWVQKHINPKNAH